MTLPVLLAGLIIFVAVPLNWIVAVRLARLYLRTRIVVIRERARVAVVNSLVVTLFAFVFINNSFFDPRGAPFNAFASMVITRVAILMLALPALYWLYLYRKD